MIRNASKLLSALGLFLLSFGLAAPVSALTVEYRALLDLDADTATGCTVNTVDGPVDGVEQLLITTVETTPAPGEVTGLERQECDQGTGLFGGSIAVTVPQAPPWPLGPGNGVMGSDVVETYFPLSEVGAELPIRLGLVSDDLSGNEDALLGLVLAAAPSVIEIPTLSEWALLALALLLAACALWVLRRGTGRGTAIGLALLVACLAAGGAWAVCVLDGLVDDWAGFSPLGTDAMGDSPVDTDVLALFARVDGSELCLRYDAQINQPPTAVANSFATEEDTPLNVAAPGLLGNDSDPDGDTLTAVLDTAPPAGDVSSFTLNADGSFDLTPAPNFNGDVSFTYHANDGLLDSNTVTVTVTVGPLPDGPMAVDDSYATDEDTVLMIAAPGVLDNDVDPENDPLSVVAFDATSAQGATVSVAADGSFTYDPTGAPNLQALAAGANLDDTFTYTVEDAPMSGTDVGTVTVTVTGIDDPPVAVNDAATVTEDAPATAIGVLANDDDPDGGLIQIGSVTQPPNGTVVITGGGSGLTYEPDPDFCNDPPGTSTDDFTYTLNGGSNATVAVTVTCVDDPALTATDFYRTVGNTLLEVDDTQDDPAPSIFVPGNVLANDSDPDSVLSVAGTTGVTAGAVVNMAADGTFTYVPPPGLRGDGNPATADDSFQYQLGGGELGTVEIDIDGLVWYVDNTASGGAANTGTGTSTDRFSTLSDGNPDVTPDDADDASIAGDVVYVFFGDGTNTNYDQRYVMNDGQALLGEGVDLVVDVNGTPTTLFTGNPATKPVVEPSDGVAVAFNNSSGEVAGLDVRGGNAVSVAPGGGSSVVIRDNTLTGSSGLAGLFVDHDFAGSQDLAVLRNVIGGSVGANVTNTQGTLNLVFDGNTGLESTDGGAPAAGSFSAAGGSFFVTSFSANQVAGTTATSGLRFDGVVFDANPGDADFTGDEVSAGNTTVGSVGDPVAGSALVLTGVSGDLAFGTLDLFTDGVDAVGLDVTGNGVFDAAAGTGFEITNTGGTISSANGPAVDLDPLTAGLTFGSVSSGVTTGGAPAIRLHDLAGAFTATGGTLANTSGSAVSVTGTNPGDSSIVVSLSGMTINHTAGTTPVIFGQNSTGLFSLTGSTITKGGGRLVDFDDMDGGSDFSGTTISSTSHHGKRLIDSAGTHTFADVVIGSATPAPVEGVFLQNNTGTINFGKVDVHSNAAPAFFASNGGTINVADATSQLTARGHRALDASGTTFNNVTFAGATVPAANPSATGGVVLSNNSGTLTLGKVDVTTTGGTGFSATSAGTVNVTDNTSRIDSANGPGLVINPTAVNMQFALVRSVGSGTTGISITGASGPGVTLASVDVDDTTGAGVQLTNNTAPVTINGGTLGEILNTATTTGGNALDVDGGAAAVTVAAAITNTAARSVEVTNRAGGTVTVSGSISDTGTGIQVASNTAGSTVFSNASKVVDTGTNDAVTLTNNTGHTIQFTGGGLDIDATSGDGFTATGGGTVEVGGSGNTIDTSTGTGVNIANTTIGASGVTWRSVSVNGAVNAIVLNTTGTSGDFLVTGDGTMTGGVFNRNGSGGTIQNTTGDGVSLTNANGVTLRQMDLLNIGTGAADDAVVVSGGSAIVLSAVHVQAPAGSGWESTNIGAGNRIDHGSLVEDIATSNEAGVRVRNTATAGSLTLDASTFRDQAQGGGTFNGNSFVEVTGIGSGFEFVLNVQNGCIFEDIFGNAINVGAGSVVGDTVTMTTNVSGSTFRNSPTGGLGILGLGSVHSATSRFDISGNTFLNLVDLVSTDGVIDISSFDAGILNGTVSGNTLGGAGGDELRRRAIHIQMENTSGTDSRVRITNNDINNTTNEGIGANIFNASNLDLTIDANRIGDDGAGGGLPVATLGREGVELRTSNTATLDVEVSGNRVRNFANGGTDETMDIDAEGSSTLNARVLNSVFTSSGSSDPTGEVEIEIDATATGSNLCLHLDGSTVATTVGGGSATFELDDDDGDTSAGSQNFKVQSLADLAARNTGTLNVNDGSIVDNGGPCPAPNLPTFP